MRQVHFLDQPNVVHHLPNCWSLELVVEPVDGVDLVDRWAFAAFLRVVFDATGEVEATARSIAHQILQ